MSNFFVLLASKLDFRFGNSYLMPALERILILIKTDSPQESRAINDEAGQDFAKTRSYFGIFAELFAQQRYN